MVMEATVRRDVSSLGKHAQNTKIMKKERLTTARKRLINSDEQIEEENLVE